MSYLTEAQKRDFIHQLIRITENNTETLTTVGYDPTSKITSLKDKSAIADSAEVKQQEAAALAKDATNEAQKTLMEAYEEASNTVELMAGLLGKNHSLIKEIRKMRK